ncbi:MAG TPA: hypothetical protein VIY86_09615, partial [Pirellulaceae bacterium]
MIEPVPRGVDGTYDRPPQSLEFLRTLGRALGRYWRLSLFLYLAAIAITVAVLLVVPRKYMSEGKFFVNLGRGMVSLDPTATTGKSVSIQETRDAEINSVADILKSRALTEKVVDGIGVDRILKSNSLVADWIRLPEMELPSLTRVEPIAANGASTDMKTLKRRERALRRLESDLKVKATKKAATISVIARASSPALAREIVEQLMGKYHDLH